MHGLNHIKRNLIAFRSPCKDFVVYRLWNFGTSLTRDQECSRAWTVVGKRETDGQTDRDRMRFG